MIETPLLLTYAAIVLGFVFIPGPATLLVTARATISGVRVGIATGAGVTAGDLLHTLMAVVGISAIISTSAMLFMFVKYLGVAYLIYLGVRALFEKTDVDLGQGRVPISAGKAFNQAVVTEVLNPKTALFFLSFLPQFVDPAKGHVAMQLIFLGVVFATLGFFATIIYSIAAGHLGNFLRRNPHVMKWQNKFIGSIYCVLGVKLALQEK